MSNPRSFPQTLKKLDEGIKEFIDVGMEMMAHSQALDVLYQRVARGELIVRPLVSFVLGETDATGCSLMPQNNTN